MATLTNDKGLDVVQDATGDGGIALTDNFKALADRAPYQAGSNPGTGDDDTQGFAPGDQWLNTSTSVLWACVSNGTGAAVWKSLYKRTETGLELIPAESTERVSVLGAISSATSLILANAATAGLQIFNTSDQVTNFEKGAIRFGSDVLRIVTSSGGNRFNPSDTNFRSRIPADAWIF
jgi:hypothetical protein